MTTQSGMYYTYSNTLPQKRMVTDRIVTASPYDITTILALGLDNSSKFRFVNEPHRSYEWLEDAYPATSDAIAATNITNSTTTTTITVTTPNLFQVGDVIQLDDEYVWVASISSSVLTIVRAFGGTTAATHASTSTAYIRYNARLEGADSSDSPFVEATSGTNYSTIFHKDVTISRTSQLLRQYGMAGAKEYVIDMNMDILLEQLNRLPYYGKRAVGSTTAARSAGGLDTFISTNVSALSDAALTRKNIDDKFQAIWAAGGKTNLILTDAWGQRKINDFYEGFVQTERAENIGGIVIKKLMHPITGAMVDVVVDRHCPAGYMHILDTEYVGYITIDPFFYEDLAKTGDGENGETVGEYGFVCQFEKAHGMLTGYSTSL